LTSEHVVPSVPAKVSRPVGNERANTEIPKTSRTLCADAPAQVTINNSTIVLNLIVFRT
jgi:hypothetical protein